MEDYPQPVTGLIKDKSTERESIRDTETRYIMMTIQGEQQHYRRPVYER